jgi:hypothetical protein
MAELKYGWVDGGRMGTEVMLARSQSFNRKAGAFVTASGATGVFKLVTASTDVIAGWAEVPRSAVLGTNDYWTSSTTVGKDKVMLIHDPTAIFSMPAFEGIASLSASLVGRYCAASAEGTTTSLMQYAGAKATTTAAQQQLFVTGVDLVDRLVHVRVNPHHVA